MKRILCTVVLSLVAAAAWAQATPAGLWKTIDDETKQEKSFVRPTEAGGVGCFVVLVLAVTVYHLRWKQLLAAIKETAVLNAMIMVVMISANFFAYIVGSSDLTERMTEWVAAGNISPLGMVFLLLVLWAFTGLLWSMHNSKP